ncbi:MAG TPA: class I SAM-dependent methyltransferase [Thermoanaerobaculia bacterium]|nr:class I SAM-dependent methyltransferase [Thermoanaerobaculia bacterium]
MNVVDRYHDKFVFGRRVSVLSRHFAEVLPKNARVLDVGSGDGQMAVAIMRQRPDLQIEGVDVLIRPTTAIPVRQFNGTELPFGDGSYDTVMLCDVIHHIVDPMPLLREVRRVAASAVAIKDHYSESRFDFATLRFMDWVGNAKHGVALPYNYWSRRQWSEAFETLGLTVAETRERLDIYIPPLELVFGRGLHFVTRLSVRQR